MNSIDDIFFVPDDEEEEEEESESFVSISESLSPIKDEPTQSEIEISEEKKEPPKKNQNRKKDNDNKNKDEIKKNDKKEKKEKEPIIQNQARKENMKREESESSEYRYKETKPNRKNRKEIDDLDFDSIDFNNQADYSDRIDQLHRMIDDNNRQFENDFEDLKSRNSEKLALLKQNNLSKEQSISNSYDLEYRNVVWTTTLHHLRRGCFSENLDILFQQAINDEQFQLEKELIELKQKNEEEIDYYRSRMPITGERRIRKRRNNFNILSPKEMARIIYDKFYSKIEIEEFDFDIINKMDTLIKKVQKESQSLSSFNLEPILKPRPLNINIPASRVSKPPRRFKSPRMIQNEENIRKLKKHQKACHNLQKTVKKADKYIRNMQENDWFSGMFPHVE